MLLNRKIVALCGLNPSDLVACTDILVRKFNYSHFSLRNELSTILKHNSILNSNRINTVSNMFSSYIHSTDPLFVIKSSLKRIKANYLINNVVVTGITHKDELFFIEELMGKVVRIDSEKPVTKANSLPSGYEFRHVIMNNGSEDNLVIFMSELAR